MNTKSQPGIFPAVATALVLLSVGSPVAFAGVVISPSAGFSITWDGNDGDFHTDAGPAPAPMNLSTMVGTQIQSSFFGGPPHNVPGNVNNGTYGNVSSWISAVGDVNPWVGIDLGGQYDLNSLAWSRDNGMSTANGDSAGGFSGQFTDRSLGLYTVQITNSVTPATATDWTSIGTLDYQSSDDTIVGGLFTAFYRHEYDVAKTSGTLMATGVRLLVPGGTAIDELELYGSASVQPVPTSDLQSWLKADGDVVTSGTDVTRWSDHSFNGNHATPGISPSLVPSAINGLPAVQFNPIENDHLNIPGAALGGIQIANSDYEIFVVAKSESAGIQFLTAAEGGGTGNFELHLNGAAGARFIPSSTATASPDTFADLGVAGMFTDGRAHIFNSRVEGNEGFLRVVGMENGDTVLNAQSSFADRLTLGIRGNASFPLDGEMGEVLIYNRALSATERREVERYLARKWNAPLNVASQTQGGVAFANEVFAGGTNSSHQIEHLNNALYGNSESWLGNNNGGSNAFAGVGFDDRYTISSLAFGRDATGALSDRTAGTYEFQYTTDFFDPGSLASVGAANWATFLTIVDPTALRTQTDFAPIDYVTGVRVLLSNNLIAIDELEVYGIQTIPEPSAYLLAIMGLVGVCLLGRRRRQNRRMGPLSRP